MGRDCTRQREKAVRAGCSPNFASCYQLYNFNSRLEKQICGGMEGSVGSNLFVNTVLGLSLCAKQINTASG